MTSSSQAKHANPAEIAMRLVSARLDARALDAFPGEIPTTLEAGYGMQEVGIHIWPDEIAAWKIGLVPPALRQQLGAERLAGPVFSRSLWWADEGDEEIVIPIFDGGFAAVEAEFVFRMGADAPAGKTEWTDDEAAALVAALHVGIEAPGSPMAMINSLGPCVVAADFGNNIGLIVGPEVKDWRARLGELTARTEIDEKVVGEGGAMDLPGGPMAALRYLLSHLASRGRPLRRGEFVSSGAVTGMHAIKVGEHARATFGGDGVILCRAEAKVVA